MRCDAEAPKNIGGLGHCSLAIGLGFCPRRGDDQGMPGGPWGTTAGTTNRDPLYTDVHSSTRPYHVSMECTETPHDVAERCHVLSRPFRSARHRPPILPTSPNFAVSIHLLASRAVALPGVMGRAQTSGAVMAQDAPICGSDDCQTAVRRKVSWLRYEAALRLLRDAKEGLGLAQDHLDRAEGKHRYSRMNVEQAEAALLEIELDVVRNFKIAGLQLLQEAAHAKERWLGMEEHKTASTARTLTISDQLATVALPKQGGRSRSPPLRRTSLVGPAADAMEHQP